MSVDLQSEIAAAQSYLRLLTEAQECKRLHERARVDLPLPLRRLLGEDDKSGQPVQLLLRSDSPDTNAERNSFRPPDAGDDWISLNIKDASPTTMALAILRGLNEPIRAVDLADKVTEYQPNVVSGSIYNLLKRLEAYQSIIRLDDGWVLGDPDAAGIISGPYIWAPASILSKTDLAAHRREAILHILSRERYLQVMEIVDRLHDWNWVQAPVNKDLLKVDMQVLEQEGRVRRIANTRNWEALTPM